MKLRITIILVALGLIAWIGIRVKSSLATRAELERSHAQKPKDGKVEGQATSRRMVIHGKAETWTPEVRLEGTLVPLREADLGFKAGGRLGDIKVKLGDYVKQGALLGRLEAAEASAQHRAAAAQVKAVEVQLSMAQDDEKRTTKVVERGVVAENAGVKVKAAVELVSAQLEAARAQLELASVNLENHSLYAPFSGYITRAPTAPGTIVGPGVPMYHLQDVGTLKLAGTVGDDDASLVAVGAAVELEADGKTFGGKLTAVLPALDPATRRVSVEAEIPNDLANPIRTGSFVRAGIRGLHAVNVVRVPASALVPGSRDKIVVIEGNRMIVRPVRFAVAEGGDLLVRAGLAEADSVLLSPPSTARTGDELEDRAAKAAPDVAKAATPDAAKVKAGAKDEEKAVAEDEKAARGGAR